MSPGAWSAATARHVTLHRESDSAPRSGCRAPGRSQPGGSSSCSCTPARCTEQRAARVAARRRSAAGGEASRRRARRSAPLRVVVGNTGLLQRNLLGRLELETALPSPVRTLRLGLPGAAAASLLERPRRVLLLACCAALASLRWSRRIWLGGGRPVGLSEALSATPHDGGSPGGRHARAASERKATHAEAPDRWARWRRELQVAVPVRRAELRWCQGLAVDGG